MFLVCHASTKFLRATRLCLRAPGGGTLVYSWNEMKVWHPDNHLSLIETRYRTAAAHRRHLSLRDVIRATCIVKANDGRSFFFSFSLLSIFIVSFLQLIFVFLSWFLYAIFFSFLLSRCFLSFRLSPFSMLWFSFFTPLLHSLLLSGWILFCPSF